MQQLHVIIFGPQGSGKGTQAALLANEYGLEHISTGALFRSEMTSGTALGVEIQDLMNRGELVPDSITNTIVAQKIEALIREQRGFILDGYPRTLQQADFIADQHIDHVFLLEVDIAESTARLLLRYEQANEQQRRSDDATAQSIRRRLDLYHAHTKPLITYYDQQGLLRRINGMQSVEAVARDIRVFLQ